MVLGTTRILLRITEGDEFGVYRINETKQRYLLLVFDKQDEAVACGRMIASFLNISLDNHFPAERLSSNTFNIVGTEGEKSLAQEKPKIKKVMDIRQCRDKLIYENKSRKEIFEVLTQKYMAAGRDESTSRKFAKWVLDEVKA